MEQTDLPSHEHPPDPDGSQTDRSRLLVVDDDRAIRLLLRKLTERSDIHVIAEADDGEEAVSLASSHQPDAVLLDVSMPVMDGLEALPWLTAVAPDARIVMHSADRKTRDACFAAGAHAWVDKGSGWLAIEDAILGSAMSAER